MASKVAAMAGLVATVLAVAAVAVEGESLPSDERVAYNIYTEPGNPKSAVSVVVVFELSAVSRSGDTVVWKMDKVTFDEASGAKRRWVKALPALSTPDGNWTVVHGDADDPTGLDFNDLPLMQGVATAVELGTATLSYDLEGDPFSGSSPYALVATELNYTLQVTGEQEPIEDTEEEPEPVEIDEFGDPM